MSNKAKNQNQREGPQSGYPWVYRTFLQPFFETLIKRRKTLKYGAFLGQSQWWSTSSLSRYQKESLDRLLVHAYCHVPYWKERMQCLGITPNDIRTLDDMRKLPIIEKDDIRAHKDKMIAGNWRGRTWTKSTGGSTGVPLELDYTPDSYDWRVACSRRGYSWAMGCEEGRKQAYVWGVAIGEQSYFKTLKQDLHHAILRQKYYNCFEFDDASMMQCYRSMNNYHPEYIIGYTNPLYELARHIRGAGKLEFVPRAVLCAAEKLHPFQREVIESVFRCPSFNTYGSREFMLIAAECEKHEGLHVSMENLYVEVIKEDGSQALPGETGDLVITDLHNYGMPFIRYRIGDMAVVSGHTCSCGRGLTLLADVVGRSLDIIRTVEGKTVPGEFFPHLMKEFKGIDRFQVIQDRLDHVEIKIVKNASFTNAELRFMQDEVARVLGPRTRIDYAFVEDIPLTKTGKYRVTISAI